MKIAFGNIQQQFELQKQTHITAGNKSKPSFCAAEMPSYLVQKPLSSNEKEMRSKLNKLTPLLQEKRGVFSLDKATNLMKQNIDEQLMLYSENDIKEVVSKVMTQNPEFSKQEVLTTLGKLSSFSNYESLSKVEDFFAKENIQEIINFDELSSNDIFQYLSQNGKKIVKFPPVKFNEPKKKALFLDRNSIQGLKNLKETDIEKFSSIKSSILDDSTKLVLLDGFEAKTNNGLKSFNFAGAWGDLAQTTTDILTSQKNTDGSVFDKDIFEDLNTIFEQKMPVTIIKNPVNELTEKEIAQRLNPKTISKEHIKNFIVGVTKYVFDSKERLETFYHKKLDSTLSDEQQKQLIQETLTKLFLTATNVYSPRKIAKELKILHTKISQKAVEMDKTPNDALYIVPKKNKSFGLINYQYSKVNNIPNEQFVYTTRTSRPFDENLTKNSFFVFMDDFSGSGQSMLSKDLLYSTFRLKNPRQPFIFAPLVYTSQSEGKINSEIMRTRMELRERTKDCIIGVNKINEIDDYAKLLPQKNKVYSKLCFRNGYEHGSVALAFTHVIPDNASDIVGLLFSDMLKNSLANKAKIYVPKKESILQNMACQNN